jgi:hypothetical protein
MAKVDFKLNDSLLHRQREQPPGQHEQPPEPGVNEREAAPPPSPAEPQTQSRAHKNATPIAEIAHRGTVRVRRTTVQTSVILPARTWDRLDRLAGEAGGLATPTRLLIDILAGGPQTIAQAADELERFLALPPQDTGLGEPWEERNLRLPVEPRRRLDEHRQALREAGVRHATRAHLVAATILQRGPTTGEEARALMAERRTEAFRRAVEADVPSG